MKNILGGSEYFKSAVQNSWCSSVKTSFIHYVMDKNNKMYICIHTHANTHARVYKNTYI